MSKKPLLALAALAAAAAVAPPAATAAVGPTCVNVLQGGDIGLRYCVNESDCLVAEYRTTFLGTERTCVVAKPGAGAADAAAAPPTQYCYTNREGEFGTRICVSATDSCTVSEYRWTGVDDSYSCVLRRPV